MQENYHRARWLKSNLYANIFGKRCCGFEVYGLSGECARYGFRALYGYIPHVGECVWCVCGYDMEGVVIIPNMVALMLNIRNI